MCPESLTLSLCGRNEPFGPSAIFSVLALLVGSTAVGVSGTDDVVREPMRGRLISMPFVVLLGVGGVFDRPPLPTPLSTRYTCWLAGLGGGDPPAECADIVRSTVREIVTDADAGRVIGACSVGFGAWSALLTGAGDTRYRPRSCIAQQQTIAPSTDEHTRMVSMAITTRETHLPQRKLEHLDAQHRVFVRVFLDAALRLEVAHLLLQTLALFVPLRLFIRDARERPLKEPKRAVDAVHGCCYLVSGSFVSADADAAIRLLLRRRWQ